MKAVHLYAAAALLAALSGCTELITIPRAVDDVRIERWLSEQRYGKVLEVLERRAQAGNELDVEKRLEEVRARAADYDSEQARIATKLLDADKLNKAEEVINMAIGHYPDGPKLQQAAVRLRALRQAKIDALEAQLLLAQADWLAASVPIYERLAKVEPSNLDAIWQAKRMEQEREHVAQRLASLGLTAHASGNKDAAIRYLKTANQLVPSEPVHDVLAHLGKQEKRKKEQKKAREEKVANEKRREEAEQLAQQARKELQHAQLVSARDHLDQLQDVDPDFYQLDSLRFRLERAIQTRVASLLRTGDDHYADGRIAEAKRVWEAGLKLAPDDAELLARVERAQRVLTRLRQLREDSGNSN